MRAWAAVLAVACVSIGTYARPHRECGTLDLDNVLTRHCFPEGGGQHSTCCIDIDLPKRDADMVMASPSSSSRSLIFPVRSHQNA